MREIAFALAFSHWMHVIKSDCDQQLGMENGLILDHQITASSWLYFETSKSTHYAPHLGRLNYNKSSGAWCSEESETNKDQYIQIDLLKNKRLNAIATQGKSKSREYVEKYQIKYLRDDGSTNYREYNESGVWKMFNGNVDSISVVKRYFRQPIIARIIRIYPRGDEFALYCLRLELFGCDWMHDGSGLKSYASQSGGIREGIDLTDFGYDGITQNGSLFGGLGKLTDDIYGNSDIINNRSPWVGYYSPKPQVIFELQKNKFIKQVMVYINNQNSDIKIFKQVDIECSDDGKKYIHSKTYAPSNDLIVKHDSFAIVINLEVETKFIKLIFTKSSKWLLISEIAFISGSYLSYQKSTASTLEDKIDGENEKLTIDYERAPLENNESRIGTEDSNSLSFPTIITITLVGTIGAVLFAICAYKSYKTKKKNVSTSLDGGKKTRVFLLQ